MQKRKSEHLQICLKKSVEVGTTGFENFRLNLAMDCGGLDEIVRAIERMLVAFQKGDLKPEIIKRNPQAILGFLDTAAQVLPDLFPDMTPQSLLRPMQDFINYERRLGK